MKRNKVHYTTRVGVKGRSRSLCGSDRGDRSTNKVPLAKEKRDVTCKHCLRMLKSK